MKQALECISAQSLRSQEFKALAPRYRDSSFLKLLLASVTNDELEVRGVLPVKAQMGVLRGPSVYDLTLFDACIFFHKLESFNHPSHQPVRW